MRPTPLGTGAFVALLALSAGAAYALGGGRDRPSAPPRPTTSASASPGASGAAAPRSLIAKGAADEAEEVELRLTHALENARIDVPSAARAEGMLASHWRRMPLPWVPLTAAARRVTTSLALRTSADETQWAMPKKDGGTWAPDAKIWNMNEGAFDQRESLFAPTPAQIAFPITVPPAARFSFAAAVAQKTREPTTFTVAVAEGDREKEACVVKVAAAQEWNDASCDLGPWAGKAVELRLRTSGGTSVSPKKVAPDDEVPALALWGNPTVLAKRHAETPYNVLFVVVDALRPDVIASFHDDARDQKTKSAPRGPLDALLPKVPGLTPTLDGLAEKGVIFTRAWSGGTWTRPGTLSMLGGALSSQIGVDPLPWVVPEPQVKAYYQSDPPLLPLLLRRAHVATRAFVNNYFMVGYAAVGVDMGFERVDDHRHRTRHEGDHRERDVVAARQQGRAVLRLRELQLAPRAVGAAGSDDGAPPAAVLRQSAGHAVQPQRGHAAQVHGRGREGRRGHRRAHEDARRARPS
ncbi:MAG: sulfatase-like hydrolase/transferase [Polyangiaceae bacterium]